MYTCPATYVTYKPDMEHVMAKIFKQQRIEAMGYHTYLISMLVVQTLYQLV